MKVAIITDQHFGCRKNSKLFHDYFLKFYNDIFFPYLEENGITEVIDMGDTLDICRAPAGALQISLIVVKELIFLHWHGQKIITMIA